jgi:hypothetical protein
LEGQRKKLGENLSSEWKILSFSALERGREGTLSVLKNIRV